MALADPLPADAFFDRFKVQDAQFVQGFQQQRSATAGGETRYADRAVSLWRAECTSIPMEHGEAEGFMALLNSRAGGLKTVLMYNKKLPYPSSDPDGLILAGQKSAYLQTHFAWDDDLEWNDAVPWGGSSPGPAAIEIDVIADRLHVSFVGFPPLYEIPLGTYFGIVFDTSRYYVGQFVEARTANGDGDVASVEVWPPLPASVASGDPVSLSQPCAKFRIEPGSAYPSTVGSLFQTIQFSAEQTYGA